VQEAEESGHDPAEDEIPWPGYIQATTCSLSKQSLLPGLRCRDSRGVG
jgi:hypothetical protein